MNLFSMRNSSRPVTILSSAVAATGAFCSSVMYVSPEKIIEVRAEHTEQRAAAERVDEGEALRRLDGHSRTGSAQYGCTYRALLNPISAGFVTA